MLVFVIIFLVRFISCCFRSSAYFGYFFLYITFFLIFYLFNFPFYLINKIDTLKLLSISSLYGWIINALIIFLSHDFSCIISFGRNCYRLYRLNKAWLFSWFNILVRFQCIMLSTSLLTCFKNLLMRFVTFGMINLSENVQLILNPLNTWLNPVTRLLNLSFKIIIV